MTLFKTALFACGLIASAGSAQALSIPFSGTIASAVLSSGLGTYTPTFDALSYSGTVGTDAANRFSVTLSLPHFSTNGPGCGTPGSGCAPFGSGGSFTVTDSGAPFGSHDFSQVGTIVTFSVFDAPEGSISGMFDTVTGIGHVLADVYVGQAFRADNRADLRADLRVSAVPLPGAAPLFGAALLLVGVAGCAARRTAMGVG